MIRRRKTVKAEAISSQLQLPVGRMARAHNRQVEEKTSGKKVRAKPGRPKRVGEPKYVLHRARSKLAKKSVLHLTLRIRAGLPTLRQQRAFAAIQRSFDRTKHADGFRLIHFSVQGNHLHLIAEADSQPALSRGMQGLNISIAKRLNHLWRNKRAPSRIFKERYHRHVLEKPAEVRNAILYVLNNAKKHGVCKRDERDFYSSAAYFDGFSFTAAQAKRYPPNPKSPGFLQTPRAWVLNTGWRRRGLIPLSEIPRQKI